MSALISIVARGATLSKINAFDANEPRAGGSWTAGSPTLSSIGRSGGRRDRVRFLFIDPDDVTKISDNYMFGYI